MNEEKTSSYPTTIQVMIVDDHPMVRQGLRAFLQLSPDIHVVAEAASGPEALEAAVTTPVDLVLMDLEMPGQFDGIETIRRMSCAMPAVRIIALTSFQDKDHILGALEAGAIGYLQKDIQPDDLLGAVRQAANGLTVLEPAALQALREPHGSIVVERTPEAAQMNSLHGNSSGAAGSQPAVETTAVQASVRSEYTDSLTERELQVLELMACGQSNKEIAAALGIAEKTVKVHVGHILAKLGVYDRMQAVLTAGRLGWVKLQ